MPQISWSADSRLLCSGSSDSTLKVCRLAVSGAELWALGLVLNARHVCMQVWSMSKKKLLLDLPGHADEVFAVDWSPDGEKVASGGRDRVMKM